MYRPAARPRATIVRGIQNVKAIVVSKTDSSSHAAHTPPIAPAANASGNHDPIVPDTAEHQAFTRESDHVSDLIATIKESADKLASDHTSRGDLKILSRTLRELRYAFKVFTPYRSRRKVTVFGSARTPPDEPAYQQAVAFGRAMAEHDWLVVTGAASGIMEAGHVGAGRENSMGLNIMLPFEQYANPIIAGDPKLVHMKYFFTRKLMFVKECDAVCLLPGGFGTLDEGLEVLTLLQTGKRDMVPVVFLDEPGGDFWTAFQQFVERQLAGPRHDLARGPVALQADRQRGEAVDEILRLLSASTTACATCATSWCCGCSEAPREQLLDEINDRLRRHPRRTAEFTLSGPLPEERDEPRAGRAAAADLPLQPPQPAAGCGS